MRGSFYITLPSNSSMMYYPQNTVTNYITHLPQPIELDGEWEVAVVELIYPCTFLTISEESKIFIYSYKQLETMSSISGTSSTPDVIVNAETTAEVKEEEEEIIEEVDDNEDSTITIPILKTFSLPTKEYNDERELINIINKLDQLTKYLMFDYDRNTKKVTISTRPEVFQIELTHTLALQLGFDPSENNLKENNKSIRPANLRLGLPSQIYIYCDVVDVQFIGDTMAPLIQIANVDTSNYTHGANKSVQFNNPHYVPLLKHCFESLEIDLRDHTGKPLAFQFGTSCVKLHFRKRESN